MLSGSLDAAVKLARNRTSRFRAGRDLPDRKSDQGQPPPPARPLALPLLPRARARDTAVGSPSLPRHGHGVAPIPARGRPPGSIQAALFTSPLIQTIEAFRVIVKEQTLLGGAAVGDNLRQSPKPLLERRRLRTDRPVAAEHHALWSENLQRMIDDRRQVVRAPVFGPGGDDDTGYFADHVFA